MREPVKMAAANRPINQPSLLERARRWRPTDPGLAGLRRASRAALVMPAAFAFAKLVLRDPQATTFVAFGCFSLIVLADFGGMRRPRAVAYLVATGVGAALVALGTLATPLPWLAALAMLVVGFWIQFAGVFGGYTAASQTALMLAFVLAVSVPAPPEALAPRVGGWLLAGAVSTVACILLWPRFERVQLMRRAATACHALGGLIAAWRHHPDSEEERSGKTRRPRPSTPPATRTPPPPGGRPDPPAATGPWSSSWASCSEASSSPPRASAAGRRCIPASSRETA
jgi:uncharacterized membrane protein YccC